MPLLDANLFSPALTVVRIFPVPFVRPAGLAAGQKTTYLIQLNEGRRVRFQGATTGALNGDPRRRRLANGPSQAEAEHANAPESISAVHLAVVALSRLAAER